MDERPHDAVTTHHGQGESGGPRPLVQQGMSVSEID